MYGCFSKVSSPQLESAELGPTTMASENNGGQSDIENKAPDEKAELDTHIAQARKIELLPDLFVLLQQLESGEIQAKDFENNSGTIRVKINKLRQHLMQVEGICESVSEREEKIESIRLENERKEKFLASFKERVLKDLS